MDLFSLVKKIPSSIFSPIDKLIRCRTQEKIYVIGDVHGCYEELMEMLDLIGYTKGVDKLIFAGDIINKGPKSLEVLRFCMNTPNIQVVKGNHETNVLGFYHDKKQPCADWIREITPQEVTWLENLPNTIRLDGYYYRGLFEPFGDVIVVHAGVNPLKKFEENTDWEFQNIRSLINNLEVSNHGSGTHWTKLYRGEELIVYGHDAKRRHNKGERFEGLDAGCVYGDRLLCLELPSRKLYTVQSRQKKV